MRDTVTEPAVVSCEGKSAREINREIRGHLAEGRREIRILEPGARHNLGVGLVEPARLLFEGSVGYYCGGLCDGVTVTVRGSAGWGLAEGLLRGTVLVEGSAGNGAAAAIRGGTVVIRGDAGARTAVSMKGGTVIVEGGCGTMCGFMAQKGTLIVCGDAGEALADSMYEGVVYVGGAIASLGNDAVVSEPSPQELEALREALRPHEIDARRDWKRVAAGRRLWNFDRTEALWREAL